LNKRKDQKELKIELTERQKDRIIDGKVAEQFGQQRLLACVSSRPGQSGRADGYIL
jgi:small subunit ribosomal protein S8e